MGYQLAPAISFCRVGGRYLFLDTRRDRYFCLDPQSEESFARLAEGKALAPVDAAVLERLTHQRLLAAAPGERRPQPEAAPQPARTSLLDAGGATSSGPVLNALRARQLASVEIRLLGLHRALKRLRRAKRGLACPARDADPAPVAAAFAQAGLLASAHNRCLPIAIAAAHALIRRQIAADLIVGVMLRPFSAHSWVQAGDRLVTDRLDSVRAFTPILVI